MKQENYYQAIFKRKSIRKYAANVLESDVLREITMHLDTLKPMYDNIKTEMKIVSLKDVKSLLPIKAPHYILVYSEVKEGYLENVGFMLQQIDLYFSANDIGSCWVGMARPAKGILTKTSLEFVVALAFGDPAEPIHRISLSQFKRKSLEEISSLSSINELLEPARLAPSATNSQPWLFTGREDAIHAYCVKSNMIKAVLYEKMNRIDMGIAICHLWIAAKHFGKKFEVIHDEGAQEHPPKGYYYIATLKVE